MTESANQATEPGKLERRGRCSTLAGCTGIVAVGLATFWQLRPTNFRGYDEWLIFWVLSRRIFSVPYANRPLAFLWQLPAWLWAPDRLSGFVPVYAFWLTAVGVLTYLLVRRLVPRGSGVAFLAGVFAVVWMPSEGTRVAVIQMMVYAGCTAAALLATWLFVEAWCGRRSVLLLPAAAVAAAAVLSHEAALPILASAPFLVLATVRRPDLGRWLAWMGGTVAFLLALAARAILPLSGASDSLGYQMNVLGQPRPAGAVLRQLGLQLGLQLRPVAATPLHELATFAVLVAVVVFALAFLLVVAVRGGREPQEPGRRALLLLAAAGVAHALLAYLPFVLTRAIRGADRTEFLAAPGVAVLLAATISLAGSLFGRRARLALVVSLAAWPVAVGTARTLAQQRDWGDGIAGRQAYALRQLTALAPALRPHTLVVLLQERGAWTFNFSFSKAIEYLYEDRARGFVPGSVQLLLETRLQQDAVVSEPVPPLRSGWQQTIERYRYDELVVFAENRGGELRLVRAWPDDLGPLPTAAVYAPSARILSGLRASPRLAILDAMPLPHRDRPRDARRGGDTEAPDPGSDGLAW